MKQWTYYDEAAVFPGVSGFLKWLKWGNEEMEHMKLMFQYFCYESGELPLRKCMRKELNKDY